MKKFLSFLLVFSIVFCTSLSSMVYANDTVTFQLNEIDFMKYLLSLTDDELISMGCTEEKLNEFRNYDFNQELINFIQRKELQSDYTQQDKAILSAYDGAIDAIEYLDATPYIGAVLTFNVSCRTIDKNHVYLAYSAVWNECPIWTITDIIALAWQINDKNSYPLSAKIFIDELEVLYYLHANKDNQVSVSYPSRHDEDINKIYYEIEMSQFDNLNAKIALEMYGIIWLEPVSNSSNIHNIQFLAGYGHTQFTISPSVSFATGSLSFSFSAFVNEEHKKLYTFSI